MANAKRKTWGTSRWGHTVGLSGHFETIWTGLPSIIGGSDLSGFVRHSGCGETDIRNPADLMQVVTVTRHATERRLGNRSDA